MIGSTINVKISQAAALVYLTRGGFEVGAEDFQWMDGWMIL